MTAQGAGELLLAEYRPRSRLVVPQHAVTRARVPAIDAHNHLGRRPRPDGKWIVSEPQELLRVLDACNISAIVNLDGMWGDYLEENLDRYDRAYPGRVVTFARVDWDLLRAPRSLLRAL